MWSLACGWKRCEVSASRTSASFTVNPADLDPQFHPKEIVHSLFQNVVDWLDDPVTHKYKCDTASQARMASGQSLTTATRRIVCVEGGNIGSTTRILPSPCVNKTKRGGKLHMYLGTYVRYVVLVRRTCPSYNPQGRGCRVAPSAVPPTFSSSAVASKRQPHSADLPSVPAPLPHTARLPHSGVCRHTVIIGPEVGNSAGAGPNHTPHVTRLSFNSADLIFKDSFLGCQRSIEIFSTDDQELLPGHSMLPFQPGG